MTKENNMLYLNMNNKKNGIKYFKCNIPFDYYLIQKTFTTSKTIVNDFNDIELELNLKEWEFLPNMYLEEIKEHIVGKNDIDIFSINIKDIKSEPEENYTYKCVASVRMKEIIYKYINDKYKQPECYKIIFSRCNDNYKLFFDETTKLGSINTSYYMKVNKEEGILMEKASNTTKYKKLMKSFIWSHYATEKYIFRFFRKKWYKYFLED